MSSQSDITQQFLNGGVVPADLVGQETVSKTYVDGQIGLQDAEIASIGSQASTAQATIDSHKASAAAHSASSITYSGSVSASTVKGAIDTQNQRIDNIVAAGGTSNIEIVDARQPASGSAFAVLRDRLNNTDTRLTDIAVNVRNFGAIGDGVSHPLSEVFSTLADAQEVYPHAVSLSQEIDAIAAQMAINSIEKGKVYWPKGVYMISGLYPLGYENDYPARKHDGITIKSNIIFEGNNATLRATANCAYIFTSHLEKDINSDEEAFQNITIRGLTFEKEVIPFAETRAFYHLVNIETCINLLIENCKFNGWSGDAICIGTLAYADLSDWHKTVVKNVRIKNCDFDGVDHSNRQGISIVCGQDVFIDNCNFVRTTHAGMPGAIDIEPDRIHEYAGNIHISNCTFDLIGDGVIGGCVCFVMPDDLAYTANNFSVRNCTMKNSFRAIQVLGKRGGTEEVLAAGSPHTFEFSNNNINNCDYWFVVGGVDNVTIRNERVDGIRFPTQIGSTDYAPLQQSVSRFYMDNNTVKNFIVNDGTGVSPILINGAILGGAITKNTFIDCGNRYSESSYELFRVFRTSFTKHKNLYYADNVYIKTGVIPFLDEETILFQLDNSLSYGSTILIKDNNAINIKTLRDIDYDIHRFGIVVGAKGQVSQQNWFNSQSSYDDSVLPDAIPLGMTSSGTGDYTLLTLKPGARDISRLLTVQLKFDISAPSVVKVRKPNNGANSWASWFTITGA